MGTSLAGGVLTAPCLQQWLLGCAGHPRSPHRRNLTAIENPTNKETGKRCCSLMVGCEMKSWRIHREMEARPPPPLTLALFADSASKDVAEAMRQDGLEEGFDGEEDPTCPHIYFKAGEEMLFGKKWRSTPIVRV
ncbi:unnamed protein product [Linum trigynum]|uniref:Uncharacterized protein n=1 Tax=Linum trigynum TaxID=586398 RepID=A0AAV2CZ59_9ROSI